MPEIDALMAGDDLVAISDRLLAYDGDNAWLQKARDGFVTARNSCCVDLQAAE